MFWPHDPEAQGNALPKPWPIYTIGLMGIFVITYIASLFGSGTEQAITSARERVICSYLKRDYTKLPSSVLRLLPREVRRHHKRTSNVMLRYDRDPSTAKALGEKWLQSGDWDTNTTSSSKKSCLEQAVDQGKFVRPPRRRLFVAMAQLSSHDRHRHQKQLDKQVAAYHKTRQSHPLYGWGLIGSERRWFTFVTSLFLVPSWFVLCWQLLLLWILGSYLARRWKSPLWLGIFWISALLGNFILLVLIGKSDIPMVGFGVGTAALIGMWAAATDIKDVSFSYWKPKAQAAGKLTFQGWFLPLGWLVFAGLSALLFHPHPLQFIIVLLIGAGIGAGALFALERFGLIIPQLMDAPKAAPLVKGRALSKQTFSGSSSSARRSSKPKTKGGLKLAAAKPPQPRVDRAKIDNLNEQVNMALAGGKKDIAIEIYRDAIKEEKGALWVLEGLLITCEKAAMVARPDEYLRAIRAAATNKDKARTNTFLGFLERHRKTGALELTSRDQLGLSTDLRRVGLYREALEELEDLLQENEDNAFYIKGALLKASCMHELNKPAQEVIALLNQLEPLLEKFPDFRGVLMQEQERAQKRLGVIAEDIEDDKDDIPVISGPAIASTKSTPRGAPTGPFEPRPIPTSISAAPDESREVDVSLLEEIEMFEALRAPSTQEPAADSWSELPALLLHQDSEPKEDDGPSMFENKKENVKSITDDGKSAQQRLAEEVTAAFDVSSLQSSLGGSDWGTRWDDDDDKELSLKVPENDDAPPGGFTADQFSTDSDGISADGFAAPGRFSPASFSTDGFSTDSDGMAGVEDLLLPNPAAPAPEPEHLPAPTEAPSGLGLLPMMDEELPVANHPPAVPATPGMDGGGLIPMGSPPPATGPASAVSERHAQETMGNYQASLPPILQMDKPAKAQSIYETQQRPVVPADPSALLPDADKPVGGGFLDLTEEIEE